MKLFLHDIAKNRSLETNLTVEYTIHQTLLLFFTTWIKAPYYTIIKNPITITNII
jgi:hypothetical protein